MKKKQFALLLGVTVTCVVIFLSACKKLNDATDLGGDLIPVVDNITTFDTTLTVETYNDIFALLNDSTRSFAGDEHFLGKITSDPIFGATDAQLFLELKPSFYRYSFQNIGGADSLFIDSAVLVLDYVETYGDTTIPQTLNVYEITSEFKFDSSYYVNRNTFTTGLQLGSRTIFPHQLNDSVKAWRDTTKNQLRIRLEDSFGQRLLNYDSTKGPNGAYNTDSLFRTKFKGFAVRSEGGGNAIMGFNLQGANTKLAIYYRYQKGGTGIPNQDTTVNYFNFTVLSASANLVQRTHSAAVTSASDLAQDQLLYIQTTPGTFATIKVPALGNLSNRLVHRAELIMEQVYDASDTLFPNPDALFLDAYDSSITESKFRTIPYDFVIDVSGAFNLGSFGVYPQNAKDASGNSIKVWKFNISRYVQHVLTKTLPVYPLRVFAPYYAFEQYGIPSILSDSKRVIYVNPGVAKGRVRLGGGNHPTQRMRLRIIYSKI